jgi:hypothetical protein
MPTITPGRMRRMMMNLNEFQLAKRKLMKQSSYWRKCWKKVMQPWLQAIIQYWKHSQPHSAVRVQIKVKLVVIFNNPFTKYDCNNIVVCYSCKVETTY